MYGLEFASMNRHGKHNWKVLVGAEFADLSKPFRKA